MADGTKIEWCDSTWNIITGCSVLSPGCTNCYAMRLAGTRLKHHHSRSGLTTMSKAGPVWNSEVRWNHEWETQPLRWARPRRIFVCAHADLFHENVPDAWLDEVCAIMALATQHICQVLTKRSERMRKYLSDPGTPGRVWLAAGRRWPEGLLRALAFHGAEWGGAEPWPLRNVHVGVSVEDQSRADERVIELLQAPAAVRWVSAEPLLGPIDFHPLAGPIYERLSEWYGPAGFDPSGSQPRQSRRKNYFPRLDWMVVGGESGPGSRAMNAAWARQIRDDCAEANVPFFFKQWGDWLSFAHESPCVSTDSMTGSLVVKTDGRAYDGSDVVAWNFPYPVVAARVGKKIAGRMLDGRTHDAQPEALGSPRTAASPRGS